MRCNSPIVTQALANSFGQALVQRIAVREKARVQALFLSRLYAHPESQSFVLCGSAALHGVYLHGRWAKDLDFCACPDAAQRFADIAADCGLTLTVKDDDSLHTLDRTGWTFGLPRTQFPEARIAVEVFTHERFRVAPVAADWTADTGDSVRVWAKPLHEMLAVKIGCCFQRAKAVDFVDLWLGLKSDLASRYAVREVLQRELCFAGDFTPPTTINVPLALSQMDSTEAAWNEKLSAYMKQPPPFSVVRDDLTHWLPLLAGDTK